MATWRQVEAVLHYATSGLEQALRRQLWKVTHPHEAEKERLRAALFPRPYSEQLQYALLLDVLGFTAMMEKDSTAAHKIVHGLRGCLEGFAHQHPGRVTCAMFSDTVYATASDFQALNELVRELLLWGLTPQEPVLLRGLIDFGDYTLRPPPPTGGAAAVYWAGRGVLSIAWQEKMLPKGAVVFLTPAAEGAVLANGTRPPTIPMRALWTTHAALDWTRPDDEDVVAGARQKLERGAEQGFLHTRATIRWLERCQAWRP